MTRSQMSVVIESIKISSKSDPINATTVNLINELKSRRLAYACCDIEHRFLETTVYVHIVDQTISQKFLRGAGGGREIISSKVNRNMATSSLLSEVLPYFGFLPFVCFSLRIFLIIFELCDGFLGKYLNA